jgi:hypothetical protein
MVCKCCHDFCFRVSLHHHLLICLECDCVAVLQLSARVRSMTMHPDGSHLTVGTAESEVVQVEIASGDCVTFTQNHHRDICALAVR